jgi:hypothetical protein
VLLIAGLVISLAVGGGSDSSSDSTAAGSGQTAASVASFGSEANSGDRAAASAALQHFLRAWIHRDSARACSLMSASTKQNLAIFASTSKTCTGQADAVRSAMPPEKLAQIEGIHVTGVRVEGDSGYVLYRDSEGNGWGFPVTREGSAWKVGAILGQPLQ